VYTATFTTKYVQCECIQVALWSKMCPTAGFIGCTKSHDKGMLRHHKGICRPSRSPDTVNIVQIQRPDIQVNLDNDYHASHIHLLLHVNRKSLDSAISKMTGYRLDSKEMLIWFLPEATDSSLLHSMHTGYGPQPGSSPMSTKSEKVISHLHLAPWLRTVKSHLHSPYIFIGLCLTN
jgi:hypothetical protein